MRADFEALAALVVFVFMETAFVAVADVWEDGVLESERFVHFSLNGRVNCGYSFLQLNLVAKLVV